MRRSILLYSLPSYNLPGANKSKQAFELSRETRINVFPQHHTDRRDWRQTLHAVSLARQIARILAEFPILNLFCRIDTLLAKT